MGEQRVPPLDLIDQRLVTEETGVQIFWREVSPNGGSNLNLFKTNSRRSARLPSSSPRVGAANFVALELRKGDEIHNRTSINIRACYSY
jgi:hypothetical protein